MRKDSHSDKEEMVNRRTEKISPDLGQSFAYLDCVSEKGHDPGNQWVEVLGEVDGVEVSLKLWLVEVKQTLKNERAVFEAEVLMLVQEVADVPSVDLPQNWDNEIVLVEVFT